MRKLVVIVMLMLGAAGAAAAPAPDAAAIIEMAAARPGEQVPFTEERQNELLSEPLVFEGYVAMQDDGTLLRVVERPFQETATIDGEQATLTRDGRTRRVDLDRPGRGGAYLRTLYALLRGDAAALESSFDLEVSGERESWQLVLTPSQRALERWLERIVVSGSGDMVKIIRMEREGGAWQEMRLRRSAS